MGVIATDIPGSSLTIAYTNYQQDGATRRFLTDSTNRANAITEVKAALVAEGDTSTGDGYGHPDVVAFGSTLSVNRITASAIGPDRWMVSVEYISNQFTGLPTGVTTLMNAKVSYESVQVWCAPTAFQEGLPFGNNGTEFLHPGGPEGTSSDPKDPPQAWIFSRPVMSIQEPFSQTTNPLTQGALENVGKLLRSLTVAGHTFTDFTARFDGADITSTSNSGGAGIGAVTFSGVKTYSASPAGFHQQILKWDEDGFWYCVNQHAFRQQ